MKNIIVMADKYPIRTSKHHIYSMMEDLMETYDFIPIEYHILPNKSSTELTNLFSKICGGTDEIIVKPKNILFFEHMSSLIDLDLPEINVNIILDDIHHQGRSKKDRLMSLPKIHRIFSTYAYCFGKFFPNNTDLHFLPHSGKYVANFNLNPINKILISGRLNPDIYPKREIAYKLSKRSPRVDHLKIKFSYRVDVISQEDLFGDKYTNTLSQYIACFTCDASHERPYILAKHFEILCSGSLLVAANNHTRHYFEKLGFVDKIHYLSIEIENLESTVNFIVDPSNREYIDKIRLTGHEFAKKNHLDKNRSKYITDVILNDSGYEICQDGINNTIYKIPDRNNLAI